MAAKEKWYERKAVPVDVLSNLIYRLGTHATTVRLMEEMVKLGYTNSEDVIGVLTDARRREYFVLQDGWWRLGEE